MLTPERLRAIRERCERATEGPWVVVPNRHKGKDGRPWGKIVAYLRTPTGGAMARNIMTWGDDNGPADAEFAAHAREDVPALVAEVERLWALRDGLRDWIDYLRCHADGLRRLVSERVTNAMREASLLGHADGLEMVADALERLGGLARAERRGAHRAADEGPGDALHA